MKCKICDRECAPNKDDGTMNVYLCEFCGQYDYQMTIEPDAYNDKSNFYKVSSWIREQNDSEGKIALINNEKFNEILDSKDKKIKDKFNLMMQYLFTLPKDTQLNEKILVKCWIKNTSELDILLQKAEDYGFIEGDFTKFIGEYNYPTINNLTFDGLQYIEELEEPNKDSKKIFVAFHFDKELTDIFNINLKSAIESEGFEYVIVNQENVEHNKSINDEIIVKLKTSRIVIADVTEHRNNVYFEAGYAFGMNLPVIWTCREDHKNDIPFDTRQFPHILWKDKEDLVKQVITKIKRII